MKVYLVDDEQQAIDTMTYYLNEFFPEVQILGSANDIFNGAKQILELRPDLVFIDISMPEGSGFELLKRFEEKGPLFVFVSAHSEFAFDAIRVNVFDYLLKPINLSELSRVILKASGLLSAQAPLQSELAKIQIKADGKIHIVSPEQVIYAKSEGNYTKIYLEGRTEILITKNLKKIEEEYFASFPFFRSHQSYIVNLHKVLEFDNTELLVEGRVAIPVSKARLDEFREAMLRI